MKFLKNNYKKIFGYIIIFFCFYFVFLQLISFDIDFSEILSLKNIILMVGIACIYAIIIAFAGVPWNLVIKALTKADVDYSDACLIWSKSNILKYLPGNVFQYVGRNQIAIKYNIDHFLVATSSLFEVAFNIIGTFIIGVILYFPGLEIYWENYFSVFLYNNTILIIIVAVIALVAVVIISKLSQKYKEVIKQSLTFKNMKVYAICITYYALTAIISAFLYIAVLVFITGASIDFADVSIIMGAFMLSWIVGFITPGAPGGIGVREVAMSLILSSLFSLELIMVAIIIYRVINILGDFLAIGYNIIFAKFILRRQ